MLRHLLCLSALASLCLAADSGSKPVIKEARELGRQGSTAIPQLLPLLKDESADVRLEAAKSLTGIGTQASLDPLIQATRDNDPNVQVQAVDGLVNFYVPGYIQTGVSRLTSAVKGQFQKENSQVIEPFVTVRPEVVSAIGELVRSGADMNSRANAARAAGILRGKAAVPDLVEALHSKNDAVIYESLIALQKIGDRTVGPRVSFLFRDLQERVQSAALETAGLLQARDTMPDIHRAFDTSRSEKVRKAALTSLAMMPDPSSRSYFQRGFKDKFDTVRAAAAEGFGRLADPTDTPVMQTAFNLEKKSAPRLAQAFALSNLGNLGTGEEAPIPYLLSMLSSRTYHNVAQAYLQELARKAEVRALLASYLTNGSKDIKMGLARVLAGSGDESSIGPLEGLTQDGDTEVAQEAVRALRSLRARL